MANLLCRKHSGGSGDSLSTRREREKVKFALEKCESGSQNI